MLKSLPIFPLGIVVLPGNIQSLQIFEPRYIEMVKDCMKTNAGFVIVLQKDAIDCLLYTSPSPRDKRQSRMPSSA